MSFATDGFRSRTMERFRASLRGVPVYKVWLRFADELNRFGVALLRDRDIPRDDRQRLTIAVLFIRAHKSFQASLHLAELGLVSDARVVLRSAAEGAIALNALANDATFLDRLIEAHYLHQRKLARVLLQDKDYRASYAPQQIARMEATAREVDDYEKKIAPRSLQDIKWEQIAHSHCRDLYQILYRLLSGDGTHTNINAIQRHVGFDTSQVTTSGLMQCKIPDRPRAHLGLPSSAMLNKHLTWTITNLARSVRDSTRNTRRGDFMRHAIVIRPSSK